MLEMMGIGKKMQITLRREYGMGLRILPGREKNF